MRTALRTAAVAAHLLPPPCTWRAAQGTSGAGTCSAYCCISWLQLHPTATTCRSAATAGSHQGVESACAGARQPLQTQLVQESRTQQQLRPQPRAHVQQYSGWLNQRHCWSLWRTATPIVAQWQCASSCTNSAAPADAAAISHLGSRTRGAKRHYHALRSSGARLMRMMGCYLPLCLSFSVSLFPSLTVCAPHTIIPHGHTVHMAQSINWRAS
jgi:hypothetical protein